MKLRTKIEAMQECESIAIFLFTLSIHTGDENRGAACSLTRSRFNKPMSRISLAFIAAPSAKL